MSIDRNNSTRRGRKGKKIVLLYQGKDTLPPIIVAQHAQALAWQCEHGGGAHLPTVSPLDYLSGMERLRPHHGAKEQ
jgi:hypothetical protein